MLISPRKDGSLAGRNRLRLVTFGFVLFFTTISAQLGYLTIWQGTPEKPTAEYSERVPRPDIVDRNGIVLATDVSFFSLYADPRKILDVDEAVELLTATVPDLDAKSLRQKLAQPNRAFVYLKREVSPSERDAIHNLGIPGIGFRAETKRVYPMGRLAGHVLGYVDVDSKGIAGIEKFLDDQGALYTASLAEDNSRAMPAVLSIDIRVQHALADELAKGVAKFRAKAGGAIVLNVHTGEVLGLVSLPDFNPNQADKNFTFDQANRMTSGVYELGSVIKAVSFAMALDYGTADLTSRFDARAPLVIGRAVIHDFQPTRRILSLPEVFTNSSNIGTARMVLATDQERHQAFLRRVGLMDRLVTELPENAKPILPKRWGRLVQATIAFGHGFAVQPLQGAQVVAGLLNDGIMLPVTFLKRDAADAQPMGKRVIKAETSEKLRYLFRLNGLEGSARSANAKAPGYRIGGKTGTAEKVVNGRYDKSKNLTVFTGAFPMEDPQYVVMVMMDEPQATPETYGFSTSGWNAVPTGGNIIARIAPLLGIEPVLTEDERKEIAKQQQKALKEGRT
jgi:cell division protein FtsI (penicillin-binding protein 3)